MKESECIENIKNNVLLEQSVIALYELHSNIYYKIIHKYFNDSKFIDKKNELIKDCFYNIYFAAREFDSSKNTKFSSYLANKARWACLNFFNSEKKKNKLSAQQEQSDKINNSLLKDLLSKERFNTIIEEINKDQDPRVEKIFKYRYFDCESNKLTSWKDVSSKLSLSVQGCINIHNKFLKKLKLRIEK
jgi:RNA polymerase sigma factor (sigma-70 family)